MAQQTRGGRKGKTDSTVWLHQVGLAGVGNLGTEKKPRANVHAIPEAHVQKPGKTFVTPTFAHRTDTSG